MEGLWQPYVKKVYQLPFFPTFAHTMSLCYILVVLTISNIFIIIVFVIRIGDQWLWLPGSSGDG